MRNQLFIFLAALLAVAQATAQEEQRTNRRALILVDIQEFYFPEGFHPLIAPEQASKKAGLVLDSFRKNNELVVHVRHATSKDSAIHRDVAPLAGEKVVTKHFANSYRETDLQDFLEDNTIDEVIICGMMTHMCVEATARASADFGYKVIVLEDACATRDVIFGNDTVRAADVHVSTLGSIDRYYGKVMTTKEFLNP